MRLAAIKLACGEINSRASALEYRGRADLSLVAYEAFLQTINVLSNGDEQDGRAWLRVVLMVSDTSRRLALDALSADRAALVQTRMSTLLDIPDIERIETLDDIYDAINAAISIGAPRYNSGNPRGCCTVYWATGQTLLNARVTRGLPGLARALGQLKQLLEAEPPTQPLDQRGIDVYAWDLRHALDAALKPTG
jgi:hypothetical protein